MFALFPVNAWIIVPLLMISIVLASFVSSKKVKLVIVTLMTIFIVMELISIYFSGGFINYQFYVNLNINDIIEGLFIFKIQALLAIVAFFVLVFLLVKLSTYFQQKLHFIIRLAILIIALFSLNYHNGPIDKLVEIYRVIRAPKVAFNDALGALNLASYPVKEDIEATKGKNIIVLSLESFEQGFLDRPNITPNLNKLKHQYSFYPNIPMGMGSSWTTASMYTYMTGMPFLIGGVNTSPLSDISQTQLVSLGDVLHKADYQTRYIIGSPTFAGIGHIISLFGVDIISEKNYPGKYPTAPFGLYDKDTFDIAEHQVEELSKSDQPFALFISTISTHAPNGFYDQRMENVIDKQLDDMSFAAASLDYNLGQFIDYLEQKGLLANTVFYIFPDHLMMGSGTKTIATLSENPRFLYLLTNAQAADLGEYTAKEGNIYQLDLPRIILDGAQIKTNARFWTDSFSIGNGENRAAMIENNITNIATLNRSAGVIQP
ncbi:phosphoglycerol transferase [Orbus hercynius]|uniref:Phosphoglycerol transferase n=1 Tax=Orbus hercynius TaxID=593135 RepID=A0A495REX4_9GAMM|nr:LTA synthase family protein [Orbus hercynius]RKS85959.1 phosphoglycerol transferase [Orbus hercynius]